MWMWNWFSFMLPLILDSLDQQFHLQCEVGGMHAEQKIVYWSHSQRESHEKCRVHAQDHLHVS